MNILFILQNLPCRCARLTPGVVFMRSKKVLGHTQVKTTQRYAHLAPETLLAASNAATLAVGSIMGVMPNRVVDVPLVAAQG